MVELKRNSATVRLCVAAISMALLVPTVLSGKRPAPKPIKPVIVNGITYSAVGDGNAGYVVASETSSGRELWRVRVFKVHIKFWIEEDVQWVYITDLRISGNELLIRDEKVRCYGLDLIKRKSKQIACSADWQTADDK